MATTKTISFESGDATKEFRIPLIDDSRIGREEAFEVKMTLIGPSRPSVTIGPRSMVTVIIEDDTSKKIMSAVTGLRYTSATDKCNAHKSSYISIRIHRRRY